MKKIIFSLLSLVLVISFHTMDVKAELTEEKMVKTITNDFIKTHNIKVDGYNYIPITEFAPDKDNLTSEQKSLSNIVIKIAEKQIGGDWSPLFYIDEKNKKGYVMEKKLSGINNLYILSYDHALQNWNITNKSNKMGTDLVELGLLKSAN